MVNPLGRSSPVRMMGLASGMDTDFIIQQTMRMHQSRIDNQLRARTTLQWRIDTHNNVSSKINTFRDSFLRSTGPQGMLNRNMFLANTANVLSGNANGAVSVRAMGGTAMSNVTINRVYSLASRASVQTDTGAVQNDLRNTSAARRLDSFQNHPLAGLGFSTSSADRNANITVNGRAGTINETEVTNAANWAGRPDMTEFAHGGRVLTLTRTGQDAEGRGTFSFTSGEGANRITGNITFNNEGVAVVTAAAYDPSATGAPTQEQINTWAEGLTNEGAGQLTWNAEGGGRIERGGNALTIFHEQTFYATVGTGDNATQEQVTIRRFANTAPAPDPSGNVAAPPSHVFGHQGSALDFFSTQTIRINDTNIELRSNMTVSQMMNTINHSNAGVRMTFEAAVGRFHIESTVMGADATVNLTGSIFGASGAPAAPVLRDEIEVRDEATAAGENPDEAWAAEEARYAAALSAWNTANATNADQIAANNAFFSAIGIGVNTEAGPNQGQRIFTGTNARIRINDHDVIERNSNVVNVHGLEITLRNITGENDPAIRVGIERDVDTVIDRIRTLVDAYNAIIQKVENLTRERRTPAQASYRPLIPEERAAMSEREAEEWDSIARIGIMRNDGTLQRLANDLRRQLTVAVDGAGGWSPMSIGIETGRFMEGTGGQIVLNEDRLRAALEEDPDRVATVFAGTEGNQGLLWRMNTVMNNYSGAAGSGSRSIRNLETSIRRNNEQVERMQMRMWQEEERMFRQFAAMETAMARMQNQGDWFSSMLGGLQR